MIDVGCVPGDDRKNIITWMDHRAVQEANTINKAGDEHRNVLRFVGGAISCEMEVPKLMWLKTHLPASWARAARVLDLTDYLTWRATGSPVRSVCTASCKWTFVPSTAAKLSSAATDVIPVSGGLGGWDRTFFTAVGLGDLVNDGCEAIGSSVAPMGTPLDGGVTPAAAKELGVRAGTAVGVGAIDAHAGGLGMIGFSPDAWLKHEASSSGSEIDGERVSVDYHAASGASDLSAGTGDGACVSAGASTGSGVGGHVGAGAAGAGAGAGAGADTSAGAGAGTADAPFDTLCLIAGTSTCHMALSRHPVHVPGVWGPFHGAMVPDTWLLEAGQSASGA